MKLGGIKKRAFSVGLSMVLLLQMLPIVPIKANAWDSKNVKQEIGIRFYEDETPGYRFYLNAGERYILETVKEPNVGSIYGEWSVMDLLRGMYTKMDYINAIPADYFTNYEKRVENYVAEKKGILDRSKSTEWSRMTLSLTAMGHSVTNVNGYNFVDQLSKSFKFSYKQGINGPIWEIIALNTGRYTLLEEPSSYEEGDINSIGKMIDYIVEQEITQTNGTVGGFALTGAIPDPDISAMALQALAPYYLDESAYESVMCETDYEKLCQVVERDVYILSTLQLENGGYESWGSINSESIAQVIVALTALNIDPLSDIVSLPHIGKTCTFITKGAERDGVTTNNMIDAILTFYANGSGSSPAVGGFKHVTAGYDGGGNSGVTVNAMATDQAVYALIAYDRFLKGENPLYDMSDQMDGSYQNASAANYQITFDGNGEQPNKVESYAPYAEITLTNQGMPDNFIGWNTKADGSGTSYVPGELLSMPEKNITLYAMYGSNQFSIQWELNGGTVSEGTVLANSYTTKDTIRLPTAQQITKEGCVFTGWYTNRDCTGTPIAKIEEGSYGDYTFYAGFDVDWTSINEFYEKVSSLPIGSITLQHKADIEQARKLYDEMYEVQKQEVLESTYAKLVSAEQELKALESGGTVTIEPSTTQSSVIPPTITATPEIVITPMATDGIITPTLSAPPVVTKEPEQVQPTLAVTETPNGEEGKATEIPKEIEESSAPENTPNVVESAVPTNIPSTTVPSKTEEPTSTLEPSVMAIVYHLNGGKNVTANKKIVKSVQSFPLKNPYKVGYIFRGWYTEKSFKKQVKTISYEAVDSYHVYAKWENAKLTKKASIASVKKYTSTGLKIKIKTRVAKAEGYVLCVSTNKNFSNSRKIYFKGLTGKINNLKKKRVYYVRVCAYRKDSMGNKIYGPYSNLKKIKL